MKKFNHQRTLITREIKNTKSFVITTHVNPDPDAICSILAAAMYLKAMGKTVSVVIEEPLPARLKFIPKTELVKVYTQCRNIKFETMLVLDCGDFNRIGKTRALLKPEHKIINIDHHITSDSFGHFNLVDIHASSTAEVLYDLFSYLKQPLTKTIAILIYLGIMTDTGSFRYESTSAKTHAIVSQLMRFDIPVGQLYRAVYERISMDDFKFLTQLLTKFKIFNGGKIIFIVLTKGVLKKFSTTIDLRDKLFSYFRSIQNNKAIIIFTEDGKNVTRVNLRSHGKVDVAKIAHHFGGGGHLRASGCAIKGSIANAQSKVLKLLQKEI